MNIEEMLIKLPNLDWRHKITTKDIMYIPSLYRNTNGTWCLEYIGEFEGGTALALEFNGKTPSEAVTKAYNYLYNIL